MYVAVTTLTLVAIGMITTTSFMTVLSEKQLALERNVLSKLYSFAKTKYDKIARLSFELHEKNGLAELFSELAERPGAEPTVRELQQIYRFISPLAKMDEEIADVLLLNAADVAYHESFRVGRAVSLSYDFGSDPLLKRVRETGGELLAVADDPSRYLLSPSDRTLTFAGTIFDPNRIPERRVVGHFIVNVRAECFAETYREYSDEILGGFRVLDSAGGVVFSTMDAGTPRDAMRSTLSFERLGLTFINEIDTARLAGQLAPIHRGLLLMQALAVLMMLAVAFSLLRIFSRRMNELIAVIHRVREGNLAARMEIRVHDEIGEIGRAFNDMCDRLQEHIDRVFVAEIRQKEAEISALQAQINPHFLHNTLESFRSRLAGTNAEVADMIAILGRLFRWSLDNTERIVSMATELEYVQAYLELENFRFDYAIETLISMDESILSCAVPKLTLQPIVENSIVHGFRNRPAEAVIEISGARDDAMIRVVIRDNGQGFDQGTERPGTSGGTGMHIGLPNVDQRLKLLFGNEYGLTTRSSPGKGTEVELLMPYVLKEEAQDYVWRPHRRR